MARSQFVPDYFKIPKLNKKINILESIKNMKLLLTFNQLMKFEGEVAMILIFDEDSIEIPTLLSYCNYFKIKIFVLDQQDIKEIKSQIKHAQMVCIPKVCDYLKEIENSVLKSDFEETFCKISIE